jgi:purine-binding chemotaxis protein CheW
MEILQKRAVQDDEQTTKTLLDVEGKYLVFKLKDQEFGIDIMKIREIIKMVPVRAIPESPPFVKGIMNFRDYVVPVIDLRRVLKFDAIEQDDKSRIIVLELITAKGIMQMGVIVDSVTEVTDIKTSDIEETPSLGVEFRSEYILGLAKIEDNVIILLDIDEMLTKQEAEVVEEMAIA